MKKSKDLERKNSLPYGIKHGKIVVVRMREDTLKEFKNWQKNKKKKKLKLLGFIFILLSFNSIFDDNLAGRIPRRLSRTIQKTIKKR